MKVPDGQPEKENSGYLFSRAYNQLHTQLKKRLRQMDITHPQFSVLASLNALTEQKPYATQAEIAKRAGIDVMTVCGILHILEGRQFIRRMPNPDDARASAVYLLEKGKEKLAEVFPAVWQIEDAFFGRLGEERKIFNALLYAILSKERDE